MIDTNEAPKLYGIQRKDGSLSQNMLDVLNIWFEPDDEANACVPVEIVPFGTTAEHEKERAEVARCLEEVKDSLLRYFTHDQRCTSRRVAIAHPSEGMTPAPYNEYCDCGLTSMLCDLDSILRSWRVTPKEGA